MTGHDLTRTIRRELQSVLTGKSAPYNQLFAENGVACTTASVIAAALGITELGLINDADIARITNVHLLFAMFNAWQPGVFALSGWDLVGALPLEADKVRRLIADGDTRWISRGAYDLLGVNGGAGRSFGGIPRAKSLYGDLHKQIADKQSFVSRLQRLLTVRDESGIATAEQLDIPEVSHKSTLAMLHQLADGRLQLTMLNFGSKAGKTNVTSSFLPARTRVVDWETGNEVAHIDARHHFVLELQPYSGQFLVVEPGSTSPN